MMTKMENSSLYRGGDGTPSWSPHQMLVCSSARCDGGALSAVREGEPFPATVRSEVTAGDVSSSQPASRQPGAPKRTMSTASSTCDEISDNESREMEVRRLKRLKANMNERKRSQGINDCIKEQATRLRKYTDLDVGKLGKKGIMQEFTRQFDRLANTQTYPKEVMEIAHQLVRSGCSLSSMMYQQQCTPNTRPSTIPACGTTSTPEVPYANVQMYIKPPVVPSTPTSHHSNNRNHGETPTPSAVQTSLPTPYTEVLPLAAGYSTPVGPPTFMPYYSQQPSHAQYYLPTTPNSLVVRPPAPAVKSLSQHTSSQLPPVAATCMKRRSEDSVESEDASPPPKFARQATDELDLSQTPSRPAVDCSSVSSNLAILASACELERDRLSSDNSSDIDES